MDCFTISVCNERFKKLLEQIAQDPIMVLKEVSIHLPYEETPQKFAGVDTMSEDARIFCDKFYSPMLNSLLANCNKTVGEGFGNFVVDGVPHAALSCLVTRLQSLELTSALNSVVELLENWMKTSFLTLIVRQCRSASNIDSSCSPDWNSTIQLIASLPDRVANKMKYDFNGFFVPEHYCKFVVSQIILAIKALCIAVSNSVNCNVKPICELVGKIVMTMNCDIVATGFLILGNNAKHDFITSRVTSTVLAELPSRCIERFIVPLIKGCPNYFVLNKLFGDKVLSNSSWKHVLTVKLLLWRYFDDDKVVQNIIGYLATAMKTEMFITEVLIKVLDVWSDKSSLKHMPFEQHLYISKVIVTSVAHLSKTQVLYSNQIHEKLICGVQAHLEFQTSNTRVLGMVVAETLSKYVKSSDQELKFEYEESDATKSLKNLLIVNEDVEQGKVVDVEEEVNKLLLNNTKENIITPKVEEIQKEQISVVVSEDITMKNEQEVLDSDDDDDFVPYDTSHDKPLPLADKPMYLRDLLENLSDQNDPQKFMVSLETAEKLIRVQLPNDDIALAIDLLRLFIHMENYFNSDDYQSQRFSSMIAITVTYPAQCAEFLCEQFYDRNFNLRQRMDILDTLSASAKELYEPMKTKSETKAQQPLEVSTWSAIIQERLESKTKRRTQQAKSMSSANRFSTVCGSFFFPLLRNFDQNVGTLDLLGRDTLVLSHFIRTLATILHSAVNSPLVPKMAVAFYEILRTVRYHEDKSVRESVLFSVCIIFLTVPNNLLARDWSIEINELVCDLQVIVENDPSEMCRKLAAQALTLVKHCLSEQYGSSELMTMLQK